MVLTAAHLNRRIQIKRFVQTGSDGFGSPIGDWLDHGTPIFAQRRDVSDAERMSAGAWSNKAVTRFTIRATAFAQGIHHADMLTHEGKAYGIDGIKEVPGDRRFLEITAINDNHPPFEV